MKNPHPQKLKKSSGLNTWWLAWGKEHNKQIRKTLFSALFDVDSNKKAFENPIVTTYLVLKDMTLETRVKCGFIDLPLYRIKVSVNKLEKLNSKLALYDFCKYALETVMPTYEGQKNITDFYISATYDSIMMQMFNIINVSNDPDPKN